MKLAATLFTTLLLLIVSAPVHATNMYAGPLFPFTGDQCECELVNITTSAKIVTDIQIRNAAGGILNNSGTFTLNPGAVAVVESSTDGPQYCKFIGTAPSAFRGMIGCFGTPNNSDNVALPAR